MQCKTFPGKLLKNDKKMQQKDNSKSKFSKPGKSLLNQFLWFYAADSQCKWKWETIIVESPAWMGQVHIRTFASCVYQRKPLLYLHIRLRSFLLIKILISRRIWSPGLRLTPQTWELLGTFGTLRRSEDVARMGNWKELGSTGVGIGDTLQTGGHYYSLLQRVSWVSNKVFKLKFTGASRRPLCLYKFICSFCPFSDETWTRSLDPWRDPTTVNLCIGQIVFVA